MKGKVPSVVIENIKKVENYVTLTPIKGRRKYFESDNGELVIIIMTTSGNQPDGNFNEIIKDEKIWKMIANKTRGWLYVVCSIDNKFVYYRVDIMTVINNRTKDKTSKDENRYLCYIMTDDAKDGKTFMRINGGNKNSVTMFYVTKIDIESLAAEYTFPCYVYLMKSNNMIKIGHSKDPKGRLNGLKTGNPLAINLVKVLKCETESVASLVESTLHEKYKPRRVRGEWYMLTAEELIEIYESYDWRNPA